MLDLLKSNSVHYIVALLIVVNAILSSLGAAFGAIGKSDSVPSWVSTFSNWIKKVVDIFSANIEH